VIDHLWVQAFSASRTALIHPFTGLPSTQLPRLVRQVAQRGGDAIADGRSGWLWILDLPDGVLLVAVYWRANLSRHRIRNRPPGEILS
jgi:hypothetical protein